ncbi:MAG: hypothetical protein COA42_00585 [Alteromonadaceae bacterium]|nr:MAG: hypothetical protein COA42_00585 [Alteromonadaceae bacterium]
MSIHQLGLPSANQQTHGLNNGLLKPEEELAAEDKFAPGNPAVDMRSYSSRVSISHSESNSTVHISAAGEQLSLTSSNSRVNVSLTSSYFNSRIEAVADLEEVPGEPEPLPQTKAASNILGFISRIMETEAGSGTNPEVLAARLAEGFAGFKQGFDEAFQQLSDSGLLSEEVEEAVRATYDAVVQGVNDLAERYGIESPVADLPEGSEQPPVTETPVFVAANADVSRINTTKAILNAANDAAPSDLFAALAGSLEDSPEALKALLGASELDYDAYVSRDFSFNLTTRDGDTVTIRAGSERQASAHVGGSGVSVSSAQRDQFSFSVEGELDEDELRAINDLLNQVGDISSSFFEGNIFEAFDMALNIGFDTEEIARFSLDLRQEVQTKVEETYGGIAGKPEDQQGKPGAAGALPKLANFVKQLDDARTGAEGLGSDGRLIADLVEYISKQSFADDERQSLLKPFIEDIYEALDKS